MIDDAVAELGGEMTLRDRHAVMLRARGAYGSALAAGGRGGGGGRSCSEGEGRNCHEGAKGCGAEPLPRGRSERKNACAGARHAQARAAVSLEILTPSPS